MEIFIKDGVKTLCVLLKALNGPKFFSIKGISITMIFEQVSSQ